MKTKVLILSSLLAFANCTRQDNQSPSAHMIETILNMEDSNQAIIALDVYLNEKSDYGEKIEVLSEAEKVVLFVENLEQEVNNGGFNQFFFNSSGDYSHETLSALKTIGAHKTAEIVSRAYAEWPDSQIPGERFKRQTILEKITDQAQEVWNECDSQFYEYQDDLTSLVLTYVRAHKDEFN